MNGSTGAATAVPLTNRWSREWKYFAVMLCLWCFIPGLRRVLDWRAGGYSSIEVVSLLPALALLPLAFMAYRNRRSIALSPAFRFLLICWVAAYTYALIVSVLSGNIAAALYEYTEYMFPVAAALWLASQDLGPAEAMARVAKVTLAIAVVVVAYGLFQFVSPPPWDAAWVIGSDMEALGPPEPFSLRIFSTLNSTGPFADFLVLAILFGLSGLGFRAVLNWAAAVLSMAGLGLTLVRSAWLALVAGVVALLLLSPRRRLMFPAVLAFACCTAFLAVSLPAFLGDQSGSQIVDRLQTFGDLQNDMSANDRQDQISSAVGAALANPIGVGLGNTGNGTKLSNSDQLANTIDSGYVSRFYELGFLGCALYLLTIVGSVLALIARLRGTGLTEGDRNAIAVSAAIGVVMLALEAAGDSYYGITGLYFWIALAIGLKTPAPQPVVRRPKSAAVTPKPDTVGVR